MLGAWHGGAHNFVVSHVDGGAGYEVYCVVWALGYDLHHCVEDARHPVIVMWIHHWTRGRVGFDIPGEEVALLSFAIAAG